MKKQVVLIDATKAQQIAEYLGKFPFNEVAPLIGFMREYKIHEIDLPDPQQPAANPPESQLWVF